MKIIHTNFLRGWGGQSNRILMESLGAAAAGHEVLLSVPGDSELARRARAAGLRIDDSVSYRGGLRAATLGDVMRLRRLLETFRPDILHLHGGRDSWLAVAALSTITRADRPRVIRCKHNVFPVAQHPLNVWQYSRFFERIVCLSTAIVEQCASIRGVRRENLRLIPSASEAERFARNIQARRRVRAEFALKDDHIVVILVGRLRPEKGHEVLLRAAPTILAANPQVRFLLAGGGSMRSDLERLAATLCISEHCLFAGFREDVPDLLSAADIAVQPSLSEGLGTSVLEACAAGLPVVASRTGGIPDVILDSETGILVEPGSHDALASALIKCASDPVLRERLGSAGRKRVSEEFSPERLVERTLELYAEFA
ncbi:MAG: glycosyltransferase family 4 protein [Candidatus Sumerlaeaceae bacterium]|nr:glycosyltransferase family 4 protein [Candidatus Sumerlaeaceae bacterium]